MDATLLGYHTLLYFQYPDSQGPHLRVAEVQREGQELMAKGEKAPSREGDGDLIPA